MGILVRVQQLKTMKANWLEDDVTAAFANAAGGAGRAWMKFEEKVATFLVCLEEERTINTEYGPLAVVDVRLLEDTGKLKKGQEFAWGLSQSVVKTKMEMFKPFKGKELCVVLLGSVKGKGKYNYTNYYIGTAAEGRKIIEDAGHGKKQ